MIVFGTATGMTLLRKTKSEALPRNCVSGREMATVALHAAPSCIMQPIKKNLQCKQDVTRRMTVKTNKMVIGTWTIPCISLETIKM
jgi:hypothetical protein